MGTNVASPRVSKRAQRQLWQPYRDAELGLRNYWYPVCFDRDVIGDRPKVVTVLGESLLLRRVDGRVYAIEDRCLHRRVPLSHRYRKGLDKEIECYTKDTVTCWYHGFTYSFIDGLLVQNISWPGCPEVGKVRNKTYPVQEAKGLLWVYIGDGAPGELANDVMPGLLDEDYVVEGRVLVVEANWRWGVENGFDSTHVYMHRRSILLGETNTIIPLGLVPLDRTGERANIVTGPGPVGIREDMSDAYEPVWDVAIGDPEHGGVRLKADANSGEEAQPIAPILSVWLPCMLGVQNFPLPGETVHEVYVPIDEKSHLYFQLMGKKCGDLAAEKAFRTAVQTHWEYYVQDGFNGDDITAREGLQDGYTRGNGWLEEHLTDQDLCIVLWRDLASKHHRGIQKHAR